MQVSRSQWTLETQIETQEEVQDRSLKLCRKNQQPACQGQASAWLAAKTLELPATLSLESVYTTVYLSIQSHINFNVFIFSTQYLGHIKVACCIQCQNLPDTVQLLCSQSHISHDYWYKTLIRSDHLISSMDGEEVMLSHPQLRNCGLLITSEESQFSLGMWPLLGCLCSRGLRHTNTCIGSIDQTQWFDGRRRNSRRWRSWRQFGEEDVGVLMSWRGEMEGVYDLNILCTCMELPK